MWRMVASAVVVAAAFWFLLRPAPEPPLCKPGDLYSCTKIGEGGQCTPCRPSGFHEDGNPFRGLAGLAVP